LYKFDNDLKDVFPYAVGIWLMLHYGKNTP